MTAVDRREDHHTAARAPLEVSAIVDAGLGNSAYVVDLGDGSALVIDPRRDPRPYLAELERRS